jgi:histone-lysine N-methyltransferase SUV39H
MDTYRGKVVTVQPTTEPPASQSPSTSSAAPTTIDVYNDVLDANEDGYLFGRPVSVTAVHGAYMLTTQQLFGADMTSIDTRQVPTAEMTKAAHAASVDVALRYIQDEYVRQRNKVPGRRIHLVNTVNASTPLLRSKYIPEYVLQEGVYQASTKTQQGCLNCSPRT